MKSSFRFVVAALALGLFASANAAVILQASVPAGKNKMLVHYEQAPTGVLQSMRIRQKHLARWCRRQGGCTYAVVGGNNTVLAAGVQGDGQSITAPVPDAVPVPEPATIALLGAGLLGMALMARRRTVNA